MAHSLGASSPGATGVAYASGVRVMPGGSAFTLTGIFVDRITPRLMRVAAMAKATAASINGIAPSMRGQITALNAQAAAVRNVGAQYRNLGLQVKYYDAQIKALQAKSFRRHPTPRGWNQGQAGVIQRAKRRAYLATHGLPELTALKAGAVSGRIEAAARTREMVHLWQIERGITRENFKQLNLKREAYRASMGDVSRRAVGLKGLKYGAIAGIAGLAVSGLGVVVAAGLQMEYTKTAAQVRAIGQLTMTEMSNLSNFVLNQTKEIAISAEDAMGGMLTLVRAGIRSTQEMAGIADPAMKLSVVNAIDLEEAVRNILVVQNAFNLSRETGNEIAANQQILINRSLMDFSDYVDGMKYAIAWSNKLGLTYQETAASIATMTDAGIRAGIGGRGMRRMFSKFAQDLEIIEQRLKRGGSALTVFSEDGVLNLSALLHELGESGDTVDDLEFALSTFGLRGSTAFLTLAQHADEFDEHVKSQTGDINVLNDAVSMAQDSLAGQWTLLKNQLKAIMLKEELVEPMKDLVKYMKDQGGLQELTESLSDLLKMFIKFWKDKGFDRLVNTMKSFMKILKSIMPWLLRLSDLLLRITADGRLMFPLILISRFFKMGTALNRLTTAVMTYRVLTQMRGGSAMGWGGRNVYPAFVNPMYMGMWAGGGPAPGRDIGTGFDIRDAVSGPGKGAFPASAKTVGKKASWMTRAGNRLRGMRGAGGAAGGMMGIGGAASIIGIGALAAYMAYTVSESNKRSQREAMESKYKVNQVNFDGANIYGFDDLNRRIEESDKYTYESSKRYY